MLKISEVGLIRTTKNYENSTIKSLLIAASQAPFSYFTQKKITEYFLFNINFEIKKSERVAIMGRNGSGKTTFCRLIAGQLFPSTGEVIRNAKVSLFSQLEDSFFPELTGRENLEFFVRAIFPNLNHELYRQIYKDCIEFSGLEKKIDRPLETYSLGMNTRLALTIISAHPHELLILDEAHSHADEEFRTKFTNRLKKIVMQSKSFILVSHYTEDLISSCERGIVLEQGRILFDGSVDKAIACYKFLPKVDYV